MSGYELINEINDLTAKLHSDVRLMAKYGKEYAEAEHLYNITKAKRALTLQSEGQTATMIQTILKGQKDVAETKLKRDTAEVMYKTAMESVNATKLRIRMVDNQISREWSKCD